MRAIACLLLPLLIAGAAQAAEVTDFTLDNGLEVVVIEDHRAPVVVHMVWYKAGAADEPPGKSGIAHFLEHLMFKATGTLKKGELSDTVAANGGSDNAFTNSDATAYFQRIAADRLELVMQMEASRMTGLRLVEGDIATERDVVLEERNMRTENDPGALFGEQRSAAQFLNSPYGIPVIGWKHEAEALTLEDANAFYKAHYAPNNAILIVAGDTTPEEVRRLAEKYYGPEQPNPAITARARPQEPPQLSARRLTMEDARVARPVVVRTYLAPERDPGDQKAAAALTLLAQVLGGSGTGSVLADRLQFDAHVAVAASAFYNGTSMDDTVFGLYVVPADGVSLEDAEAALDAALADFLGQGDIDDGLLERIKMQIRASQIYADDSPGSVANRYGDALTAGLTVADVEEWPDLLEAVTEADILDAARAVFEPRNSVTGWLTRPPGAPAQGGAMPSVNEESTQ